MCLGGGGGDKFHQIKNNNPHVKIKFSILPYLLLFNPTFKCMQVLVKAMNLNTFRLQVYFAFPLIKRVRVAIS